MLGFGSRFDVGAPRHGNKTGVLYSIGVSVIL